MKVGNFIYQTGTDTFGLVISKQKNGSFKIVKIARNEQGNFSGKAKFDSISGWYPEPVVVDGTKIPQIVYRKLLTKSTGD